MEQIKRHILPMVAALLLFAGCNVHEYPEMPSFSEEKVTFSLDMVFDLELPPYKEIIYNSDAMRADFSQYDTKNPYNLRYIINVYRSKASDLSRVSDFSRVPDSTIYVLNKDIDNFNQRVSLTLPEGNYRFMVWTDYSLDGSIDDRYYSTDNFAAIQLLGEHRGNDDYRDAFRGEETAILSASNENNDVTVYMHRPMGKFRFIATDFDRFFTRAEEEVRAEFEAARSADGSTGTQTPAGDALPSVNLDDYRVIFRYPGFMPHIFNMFTNRPADAKTGVTFEGRIIAKSDSEAELGFDYVFVNGEEAPVSVSVEVYNKKGTLVGSSGAITVPLMRSMVTTVKGEFLTSKAAGGVGVSPEFDGEFNIVIP